MPLTKEQIKSINDAMKEFNSKGLKLKDIDIVKKVSETKEDSFIDLYKDMIKTLVKTTNANIKNGFNYSDVTNKFDTLMSKIYNVKFKDIEQKPFDQDEYDDFLEEVFKDNPILLSDTVAHSAEKQEASISKGYKLIARVNQAYTEIDAYLERELTRQDVSKIKTGMFGRKKDNKADGPKADVFDSIIVQVAPAYKALKDEYNGRSFFGKWFTFEGYRMRNAINDCETKLTQYSDKIGNITNVKMSTILDYMASDLKDQQEETFAKMEFRKNITISKLEVGDDCQAKIEDDDFVNEYEIVENISKE